MKKTAESPKKKVNKIFESGKKIFFIKLLLYITATTAILILIKPIRTTEVTRKSDDGQEGDRSSPDTLISRDIFEVGYTVSDSNSSVDTIPLNEDRPIYGLSIDADITLPEADSFVRIVLVDANSKEYLVTESYLLLDGTESFSVSGACEETCLLDGILVNKIILEAEKNASINITNINKNTNETEIVSYEEKKRNRELKLDSKIEKLNREINENNLGWTAGRTDFSELSFSEKTKMYKGKVPSFKGFEFYQGGVFETLADTVTTNSQDPESEQTSSEPKNLLQKVIAMILNLFTEEEIETSAASSQIGEIKAAPSSAYVDSWDWRDKHGADDPNSFYFDGNPDSQETGNGWITSVKNQLNCGSCWAFAATGATEALVNLYYNQHIDLDLAEQDALSCSGAGSCSGGWPGVTLDYYTTIGVVDEACFPYTATNQSCSNKCSNPSERIKISGKVAFANKTEDNLKSLIIEYGPLSGGVYSWSHAMALVGWYTDQYGSPVWIFKNSWGKTWGDHGYLYLKTPITNIGWTYALVSPVTSSKTRTIRCIDADGDGFYNWGLSASKVASCPPAAPDKKDCDDSNPLANSYDSHFNCIQVASDINTNSQNYNFQGVPVGQTAAPQEIIIGNQGEKKLSISNILLEDTDHFYLNLNPAGSEIACGQVDPEIAAGSSCSIEVTFTPETESTYGTSLRITSDDPNRPNLSVSISGFGTYDPQTVCTFFNGLWGNAVSKCFGITSKECNDYRGTENQCDYLCYPNIGCIQNCVLSCTF